MAESSWYAILRSTRSSASGTLATGFKRAQSVAPGVLKSKNRALTKNSYSDKKIQRDGGEGRTPFSPEKTGVQTAKAPYSRLSSRGDVCLKAAKSQ